MKNNNNTSTRKALVLTTSSAYDLVRTGQFNDYVHSGPGVPSQIEDGMDVIMLVNKKSGTYHGKDNTMAIIATLVKAEPYNGQVDPLSYVVAPGESDLVLRSKWKSYIKLTNIIFENESVVNKLYPGVRKSSIQGGIGYYEGNK
jgi:hypothetical protein